MIESRKPSLLKGFVSSVSTECGCCVLQARNKRGEQQKIVQLGTDPVFLSFVQESQLKTTIT